MTAPLWAAPLLGGVVGLVVGTTSMGAGALLTPGLILLLGVPPSLAIGSDLFIALVMKVVGTTSFALRRHVHWPTVGRLAAGSVPGALLATTLVAFFDAKDLEAALGRAVGVALVLAATGLWFRAGRARAEGPFPRAAFSVALGFAAGLIIGLTSVGAGSLLMAVMSSRFPLSGVAMVGTDLAHGMVVAVAASAASASMGRVDFALAGWVLLGAVPGVLIGSRLARVYPDKVLRRVLAVVVATAGVALLLKR